MFRWPLEAGCRAKALGYPALNPNLSYLCEPQPKLLVSPIITPIMLPCRSPYMTPLQGVWTIAHVVKNTTHFLWAAVIFSWARSILGGRVAMTLPTTLPHFTLPTQKMTFAHEIYEFGGQSHTCRGQGHGWNLKALGRNPRVPAFP